MIDMLSEEEYLEQSGVKGMRWGQRKADVVYTSVLKGGGSLAVTKDPPHPISMALSAISKTHKAGAEKLSFFTLKNEKGKKVGDATFYQDSPDSLNLMWIGIKGAHRGNGYASAALKGVVNYAQDKGLKKLTLEVPGNAPDALHIYSKLGFKITGKVSPENDIWGGLTSMELAVPQKTLSHSTFDPAEVMDYIQKELNTIMPEESNSLAHQKGTTVANATGAAMLTEDEFLEHFDQMDGESLEHYGKKGMKWGQKLAEANLGSAAKARTSTGNDKSRALGRGERNSAIDSARGRVADGSNKANLKEAKVAYKASKNTDGRAAAKTALRAVRDKNADDYHDSRLAKSGKEAVAIAAIAVGATILQVALAGRG